MDVLRTAVSALGAMEGSLDEREQQYSLMAKMPALAANCYRIVNGMPVVEPDPALDHASNLLYMLSGERPGRFDAWAFERELILYLEHDMNASTFTVRVVASTLADIIRGLDGGTCRAEGPAPRRGQRGGDADAARDRRGRLGRRATCRTRSPTGRR